MTARTSRSRPNAVRGGTKIATLADARAFMLDQPADIQERSSWQHAAKLLLSAAAGGDVEPATIELALFLEGRRDLGG
jgi:hypothetical protein